MEGAYVDLGEVTASAPGVGATVEVDGFSLVGTASYPFAEQFGVFAKAGAFFWDGEASATGGGFSAAASDDDDVDVTYGVGAVYNFSEQVGFRVEWERYDIDGDDVDLISAGVAVSF